MGNNLSENTTLKFKGVNLAFSKQSSHYDEEDKNNRVILDMRHQVYEHVLKFIKPESNILELNAGTGIDALYFTALGHRVHATDLSDGMIAEINRKINRYHLQDTLTCQQLSYDQLQHIEGKKFDYVFSNFGGLNCIQDLTEVTKHLPSLLHPGAYITCVIMPPVCLWELAGLLKGNGKKSLRRFNKNGVHAHLEGESFTTYYHSLSDIKSAFNNKFKLLKCEGLATLSPQPHCVDFPGRHPRLYTILRKLDSSVRFFFPFNRWADHIIVTFRYLS